MVDFSRVDLDPPNTDTTFKKILTSVLESQHPDTALEAATERIQHISNPKIALKFLDYTKRKNPLFAANSLLKDLEQHYYRAFYFYNEPYINTGKPVPLSSKNKQKLWLVGIVASLPGFLGLTSAIVFLILTIPTPLTVIMLVALLPCIVIATAWLVRKATHAFSKAHQTQHEPRIQLGLALNNFATNLPNALTDDLKSLIIDNTLDVREMMGFNSKATEDMFKKLLSFPDDPQSSFQRAMIKKFSKEFYAIESDISIVHESSWLGTFQYKKQQLLEAIEKNNDGQIIACLSWFQREGFDLSAIQYTSRTTLPDFIRSQLSEKNVGALYFNALSTLIPNQPVPADFWEEILKKISSYLEIRGNLYNVIQNNDHQLSPQEQVTVIRALLLKFHTQYPHCALEKIEYEEKNVQGASIMRRQNILHLILKYYSPQALHDLLQSPQPELAFFNKALKSLLKGKNAATETPVEPIIHLLRDNPKLPRRERRKAAAKLNILLACPDTHPTVHEQMAPTPWVTVFNKKHPKHSLVTATIPSTICEMQHLSPKTPRAKKNASPELNLE